MARKPWERKRSIRPRWFDGFAPVGRVSIPLRPKVYQVLAYLLTHYDRVVLKQELLEHVWPGQSVGDAALNSYIMDIRKALGNDGYGQRLLRTMRGCGYRFVAPVEVQDPVPRATGAQVAMPSLRARDSRTVVQAVLGAVSLPEARLQAMVAQGGGNPFFLEELAWHAVE